MYQQHHDAVFVAGAHAAITHGAVSYTHLDVYQRQNESSTLSKRIEVNDLNVYYGNFLAVEDISINIEPRSVTAFIGPSGCGKSTFLRTLNRMHEVIPGARVEGEVLLDGDDLYLSLIHI